MSTNGRLKIKQSRKLELKVNGKELSVPKEYDFNKYPADVYDCEVQLEGGKIVEIVIEGQPVPRNAEIVQKKTESANKKEQEAEFQKEKEKQRKEEERRKSSGESSVLSDSFLQNLARVPKDTREKLVIRQDVVDNFSLKLNQFARWDWHKDGEKLYFFNPKKIEEGPKDNKALLLPAFEIKANFGCLFSKSSPTQLADRQKTAAKDLFPAVGSLIEQKFRPAWRFVTGLGGYSVYETGLTLHHVYGIPYIPATSVKGVLRSWVILQKFENNEGKAIQDECFCQVFGCPSEVTIEIEKRKTKYKSHFEKALKGNVTFFDALPTEPPTIEPDIMNPHYPNWYGEKAKAPLDTESPVPIFFLTVKNTPFEFLMGSKKWDLTTETFWGKTLSDWLKDALEEHGIGAKTAVGYGYMSKVG